MTFKINEISKEGVVQLGPRNHTVALDYRVCNARVAYCSMFTHRNVGANNGIFNDSRFSHKTRGDDERVGDPGLRRNERLIFDKLQVPPVGFYHHILVATV